ncbi:DUF2336 domain-containing protein [Sphingomonas sp.]|jgi:hypothetical protein|uniref:DUF2336 domain-containing protein n=1 Tax=Sphingomonas sp. TaxID=28214 RepID=UPI002D7EF243|nr:DUF2336 domain-containing protein [Sphingomonas sp.]HEU0044909.1 DUF2336 domain-containing protein [Sphingomonas sp.]
MPADAAPFSAAARAAQARLRADVRLFGAIDDIFLADDARLDERTRLSFARLLSETIGSIEVELRRQAARLLAARGATTVAESLLIGPSATERLACAGLLRDEALVETLIARVRHELLAAALPVAVKDAEAGSLLVRLAAVPDRVVATAARALLVADSRSGVTLAAELQHRLVWWVAAAIRPGASNPDVDRAIAEAAVRSLSAHDEGDGADAIAMRLAAAIDARPEELPALLLESLGDRRLSLFVAVLAQAIGLDFAQAQALVLEPEGDRLWLALRAVQLDRPTIARIALALSDADPRRDIEAFADELDHVAAITPAAARLALAPETLASDFRMAIRALDRAGRR